MKIGRLIQFLVVLVVFSLVGVCPTNGALAQETNGPTIGGSSITAPLANVARVATLTLPPFTPFTTVLLHLQEAYSGNLGTSFIYKPYKGYPIYNLTYSANAGVTCTHNADLKITCTGAISWVTIDLDMEYLVKDYLADCLVLGWGGYSDYPLDFTIHLLYPASLTYVGAYASTPAPISVTPTQVTWYQENTTNLAAYGLFRDSRIKVIYLPLVQR